MDKYNPKFIEPKWQKFWEEVRIYKDYSRKKKFYALDMFPYPSGAGLHVGHPKGYIATDVISRFKLLQGASVLHSMGWDAFGLPAENYALKNKVHPRAAVEENIQTFKRQLELFGFTYDWDREINTTDPEFYKWTQWIFLKMFEKGLAYESSEPVNWCPSCKTVLANEDLEKGLCERCGSQVIQKKLRQWVLKMTDYADRLLWDLDNPGLEWEEMIKDQQRNWIGRSEGVQFALKIKNTEEKIEVYTTRIDTVFGMTYAVVAPEHEIIEKLKGQIENYPEVKEYIIQSQTKTELERTELQKEKTGKELKGLKIINPFNNEELPLYVADYVLGFYGTGAVMAVPAHDERDWEFAKKYNLTIKQVIAPYFYDSENPPRSDKKKVNRTVVQGIVRNGDQVLQIRWKKFPWKTFVIGGAEKGETLEEAVKREVQEETGYKNFKSVERLGMEMRSEWFAIHKDENRYAHMNAFVLELENKEKDEISDQEKAIHEVAWVSFEDIPFGFAPVGELQYFWHELNNLPSPFVQDGVTINSGEFSELKSTEAREKMTAWLEENNLGKRKVNYKMRDWVFSRQRYWGEPIPIIHCEKCGTVAVPEDELPVKLPEVEKYEPTGTGESPLANISEWVNVKCPQCGGPGKRETNTMPQWAGSSWYYLRYIDPKNSAALIDKEKEKEWMPVDLYIGGIEHATRHLLYARFWHKFLFDLGVVSTDEPFKKLVHVGLILAEDGRKMSKRWGNVINPDEVIVRFGADAMRLYEMFMGPFTQSIAWSTNGVIGMYRFLEKVWKLRSKISEQEAVNNKMQSLVHKTIKKVTEDIEAMRFNTAISQLMILANAFEKETEISLLHYSCFLLLLGPFAPHIAEELWNQLGHKESIFKESWPAYDPEFIVDEEIELVVQINGKVRDRLKVAADISEDKAKELALGREKIKSFIDEKEIKKIIYVKGRLVSIVI
ncbi:MAG: class I tRNA ligase family protein [Candidatus Pacebacteria bacterium]|nr:class I tRNA ligase family protein [Candidatus Paceibacterota bacterium]MDR3583050.1 class I tRNA ligase family protein [Candidatus Paceibacterota bacterium]